MKNALTSVLCFLCVFVFQKNGVGPLACGFVSCFSVNSPQTQRFWHLHDGAIDHTLNSDSKKTSLSDTVQAIWRKCTVSLLWRVEVSHHLFPTEFGLLCMLWMKHLIIYFQWFYFTFSVKHMFALNIKCVVKLNNFQITILGVVDRF